MKRNNVFYLTTMVVFALLFASCGGIKKMAKNQELMSFKAQPEVLEMHGDKVEVSLSGEFPAKFFAKKAIVSITPVLKYDGGETAFKTITLQGEDAEANNKVISYENGGDFSYNDIIEYSDNMRVSELFLKIQAVQGSKSLDLMEVKVADGVVSTPVLLELSPKSILGTTMKVNVTPSVYDPTSSVFQQKVMESLNADIHYLIQQSGIRWSEKKDDDILALKEYIKSVQDNERLALNGVEISSYASPDGEFDLNEKVSGKRGVSAEKFVSKELKRNKFDDVKVNSKTTAEDWAGFKQQINASDIQDKDLILRVLSMYADPVVREKEIKNMAATYKELADDILPLLRRSKLNVDVEKTGFYDKEILELVKSNPDTLNQAELLYAASLVETDSEKLDIYSFFTTKFPKDWRGPNNAGVILLKQDNLADAKAAFENAKTRNDNSIVLNNLGVCALLEKNFKDAEDFFMAGLSSGKKASYNLGICNIKKANYSDAVSKMGACKSFNTALANILNGDNNGALQILESIEDKDAMDHYLKAVVGARTGNDEVVLSSLKTAIEMDSSLAGMAVSDLEFFKYFENAGFKALLK